MINTAVLSWVAISLTLSDKLIKIRRSDRERKTDEEVGAVEKKSRAEQRNRRFLARKSAGQLCEAGEPVGAWTGK